MNIIESISRRIGILVVFGIPVIVGGGIVYHFAQSFPAMYVFEVVLVLLALGFVTR
ncbi:MAG: hypothetical protein K9J79_03280 [Desulfobacteraceae bacterium]|nr:hypothetical protein [Desulfobacteraceae bacterium]MCF8094362.1 hypothetical protein [Desulfobacteraceae bacterium]